MFLRSIKLDPCVFGILLLQYFHIIPELLLTAHSRFINNCMTNCKPSTGGLSIKHGVTFATDVAYAYQTRYVVSLCVSFIVI